MALQTLLGEAAELFTKVKVKTRAVTFSPDVHRLVLSSSPHLLLFITFQSSIGNTTTSIHLINTPTRSYTLLPAQLMRNLPRVLGTQPLLFLPQYPLLQRRLPEVRLDLFAQVHV